jgi:hypothetical protein
VILCATARPDAGVAGKGTVGRASLHRANVLGTRQGVAAIAPHAGSSSIAFASNSALAMATTNALELLSPAEAGSVLVSVSSTPRRACGKSRAKRRATATTYVRQRGPFVSAPSATSGTSALLGVRRVRSVTRMSGAPIGLAWAVMARSTAQVSERPPA